MKHYLESKQWFDKFNTFIFKVLIPALEPLHVCVYVS